MLRHLELKDTNIAAYTERFHELALLCPDAVPNERKKIELYVKGLPDSIQGVTTSSKPANLNECVHMAHTLMEQKVRAIAKQVAESNKRKWEAGSGSAQGNNQFGSNNRSNRPR